MYIQICIYLELLFIDAGLLWSLDKDCNRKKKKNKLLSKNQEWICYTNIRFFLSTNTFTRLFFFLTLIFIYVDYPFSLIFFLYTWLFNKQISNF
jgi:hypothetical protein